ncbi:trypsin-like peptidase domain-containing protein [Candidatus Microgenomates bacterium]|nr:trypsin-like peptidase domain-containing protein [Candidatus Microgenomates bacterium]
MLKRILSYGLVFLLLLWLGNYLGLLKTNLPNLSFPSLNLPKIEELTKPQQVKLNEGKETVRLLNEESLIINAVEKVSSSVVTIGVVSNRQTFNPDEFDLFSPFFSYPGENQPAPSSQSQDIGTGFVITSDGLIVTNKHVVSLVEGKYSVVTKDDKRYDVEKIYRDPANDLAILKVNAQGLKSAELGDSAKLKVGQLAIAIGTALGEFRNTVTTGVISGLGRGITAGDPFGGFQERLDDLIQTDAAINPGNSGGPLLNSGGQVVGVNVAVSAQGQNIGFAIPIDTVKEVVQNFNETGKFSRPYLGIRYSQISKQAALLNEVPEGAYIREVMSDSPAEKAGLQVGDIISKIDNVSLNEKNGGLSQIISKKKVGDTINLTVFRDGKEINVSVILAEAQS